MGGRYDFTEEDVKEIENVMANRRKTDGIAALDQSKALPMNLIQQANSDPNVRAFIREHRREREERLAARIAELGGHEGIRRSVQARNARQRATR